MTCYLPKHYQLRQPHEPVKKKNIHFNVRSFKNVLKYFMNKSSEEINVCDFKGVVSKRGKIYNVFHQQVHGQVPHW